MHKMDEVAKVVECARKHPTIIEMAKDLGWSIEKVKQRLTDASKLNTFDRSAVAKAIGETVGEVGGGILGVKVAGVPGGLAGSELGRELGRFVAQEIEKRLPSKKK